MRSREQGQISLLQRLEEIQDCYGYIPRQTMMELSEEWSVAVSDIYGIATFYSFLSVRPQGAYVIRVCKSLPCFLKNYEPIIQSIKKAIGINPGETTPDGTYSLYLTNCIGACDKAPAMMINGDLHGNLTPVKVAQVLKQYK
jgi:NADH:ubiquinone oxidoreductase subunit E